MARATAHGDAVISDAERDWTAAWFFRYDARLDQRARSLDRAASR